MECEENGISAQPASQTSPPAHCAAVWATWATYGPKILLFFPCWQQFPLRGFAVHSKPKRLGDFWTERSWNFSVCHPLRCYWSITRWKLDEVTASGNLVLHQELHPVTLWPPARLTPNVEGEGCSFLPHLFQGALGAAAPNLPLTPITGHPAFSCPSRSVPALSCSLSRTLFRNFK